MAAPVPAAVLVVVVAVNDPVGVKVRPLRHTPPPLAGSRMLRRTAPLGRNAPRRGARQGAAGVVRAGL